MKEGYNKDDSIHTTLELTGRFENIVDILQSNNAKYEFIESISTDILLVFEAVIEENGATKSGILDAMKDESTTVFDSESIIHALRILELHGAVRLEGNTWKPVERDGK